MAEARIAFACCIEAGPLEDGVVRLAASLRRFGGAFADAPVFAATPRPGPGLSRGTRDALERLGVEHERFDAREPYAWNNFMNKPHVLVRACERLDAGIVCWLDSDVLVLGEPGLLALPGGEDFCACAPDVNVGSSGPDDPNEPYWRAVCAALGLDVESLPWIGTWSEGARIRFYCNSGVFSFRRGSGFAEAFLADCRTLLDARVASRNAGIFFTDQVAMGLTAHRLGLHFAHLPHAFNRAAGSAAPKGYAPEALRDTVLLHYHDALWPGQWPELMAGLGEARPDAAAWLAEYGPMRNPAGPVTRLLLKGLKALRARSLRRHLAACREV